MMWKLFLFDEKVLFLFKTESVVNRYVALYGSRLQECIRRKVKTIATNKLDQKRVYWRILKVRDIEFQGRLMVGLSPGK